MDIQNENPTVFLVSSSEGPRSIAEVLQCISLQQKGRDSNRDPLDSTEVFEHIRHLNDPEHPLTLEQLNVVALENIHVDDAASVCNVFFTPTIPHCSMATLIGLSIRVKLARSLPSRFKVSVKISPGSHSSEHAVNKQLHDKERVAAALENPHLLKVVNQCTLNSDSILNLVSR
mmetsp:Transcript_42479/g.96147  ORF Transcript_42479/g.96147 Transcript_42479/m.96147 type:complete len:174 (+) Transcript_42479:2-523(+)